MKFPPTYKRQFPSTYFHRLPVRHPAKRGFLKVAPEPNELLTPVLKSYTKTKLIFGVDCGN